MEFEWACPSRPARPAMLTKLTKLARPVWPAAAVLHERSILRPRKLHVDSKGCYGIEKKELATT